MKAYQLQQTGRNNMKSTLYPWTVILNMDLQTQTLSCHCVKGRPLSMAKETVSMEMQAFDNGHCFGKEN